MKVGEEITLPDHLRDISLTRVGGLTGTIVEIDERIIKIHLKGLDSIISILNPDYSLGN